MKLDALDLNLLRAFDALIRERHVTRAAARLGMSQPAMSGALARLRVQFRDPLFVRTRGQMQPTPRARQLAVPIGAALAQLRAALEPAPHFDPAATQEFRLSVSDDLESIALGRLLARLRERAPHVTVRTVRPTFLFAAPLERLRAGEVDLALGWFSDTPDARLDLLSTTLRADRLVAIVRTRHPRVGAKLGLRAFLDTPQIRVLYPGDEHSGRIDVALGSRGLVRKVALVVSHMLPVLAIVADSELLGVVPESLARRWAKPLGLRVHDLPVALPPLPLVMSWHRQRADEVALAWLRGEVEGALAAPARRAISRA